MPLACLRVDYKPVVSECILVEYHPSVDYKAYANLLSTLMKKQQQLMSPTPAMDKVLVRSLLHLCESDRERECLTYAVVKSSGLSSTQARKTLGFHGLSRRMSSVDSVLKHSQYIRESIDKLARSKENALLQSFGFEYNDSSSDSEASYTTDDEFSPRTAEISVADMTKIVKDCDFNCFEILHRLDNEAVVEKLMNSVQELEITSRESTKLKISYEAFLADKHYNIMHKQ